MAKRGEADKLVNKTGTPPASTGLKQAKSPPPAGPGAPAQFTPYKERDSETDGGTDFPKSATPEPAERAVQKRDDDAFGKSAFRSGTHATGHRDREDF